MELRRRLNIACSLLLFLSACASPPAAQRAALAPAGLPPIVQTMLRAADIPAEAIGAVVIRVSDGATILLHQPDASLQPGSIMKMVTTIVGLEKLGPTMRWRTELRALAPVEDGVLRGDLFLRGGGDGDLTWEAFRGMLQSLRRKGVREIRGDLILDREFFQPPRADIGVPPFDEAPEFQYNVIPDALMINTNLLQFDLESDNWSVRARMTPELKGVSIESHMTPIDRACKIWEDGWQVPVTVKADDGSINIHLRGEFPRNCSISTSLNVIERNDFADRAFRQIWTDLGGAFGGTTREGATPAVSRLLVDHRSRTLADTLREINKPSDNPLARLMFLTLGTIGSRDGGTTRDNADRQIRAWFKQLGVDDAGLVLENGSGLSRAERIRPSQLAALLAAEYRGNWAPEFLSSLPIVGLDGTMRLRLRDSAAAGRARMKTGTLNNVVALAGYVPDASGQILVVVAIINHKVQAGTLSHAGRPILDALVDWVARSGVR